MNNSDSKRLHEYAKTVLTSAEVADMEHCIGWNRRKTYCRNGMLPEFLETIYSKTIAEYEALKRELEQI